MYTDTSGMFKDFNMKLAVINSILSEETSFGEKLEELVSNSNKTEEPNEDILSFLQKIVLTHEDLEKVKELVFDAGEDIYFMIYPDWDGEEDIFDINSIDGIEKLTKLENVEYISMISEELICKIKDMGISVN